MVKYHVSHTIQINVCERHQRNIDLFQRIEFLVLCQILLGLD